MLDSIAAPAVALLAYWVLVGICPDNWPFPRIPRWPPPPPPPWSKVVGILAALVGGAAFTRAIGGPADTAAPMLAFALTGVFAFVSAYAAREVVGRLVGAREPAGAVETPGAFR